MVKNKFQTIEKLKQLLGGGLYKMYLTKQLKS